MRGIILGLVGGIAALAVASCGGSTSEGDGSGGSSGASGSGTGGSGTGGSGTGGSGTGGSGTGGSGTGGSGTGGSGTGGSGTGGSGGGDPDRSCGATSDCVLMPASCCGQCGAATRDDHIVLNRDAAADYAAEACGPNVACPGCYMAQDPNLVATCFKGTCELADLLTKDLTSCQTDDDCVLRTHDCCACGGDQGEEGLIAIRRGSEQDLLELVCDPVQACPECEPAPPTNAKADCENNRCEVVWL